MTTLSNHRPAQGYADPIPISPVLSWIAVAVMLSGWVAVLLLDRLPQLNEELDLGGLQLNTMSFISLLLAGFHCLMPEQKAWRLGCYLAAAAWLLLGVFFSSLFPYQDLAAVQGWIIVHIAILTLVPALRRPALSSISRWVDSFYRLDPFRATVGLLIVVSIIRYLVDIYWLSYRGWDYLVLTFFNDIIYAFLLHWSLAGMAMWMLRSSYSDPKIDELGVYRATALLWIAYPMVSIVSLLYGSLPGESISFFRLIPGFLEQVNFLPMGMVAIIPVLIAGYTLILRRHSSSSWIACLTVSVLALTVAYVLFYQYFYRGALYFLSRYNFTSLIGFYTLTFVAFMWWFGPRFMNAFERRARPMHLWMSAIAAISAILLVVGIQFPRDLSALTLAHLPDKGTLSWQLLLFVAFDEQDEVIAQQHSGSFQPEPAGPDQSSFRVGALEVECDSALAMTHEWNQRATGQEPFMETFAGHHNVAPCTTEIDGSVIEGVLLVENMQANFDQGVSWRNEQFLFLYGETAALVAYRYDDYVDGTTRVDDAEFVVTAFEREANTIALGLDDGRARLSCDVAAERELGIYPLPQPSRLESLVCSLRLGSGAAAGEHQLRGQLQSTVNPPQSG